MKIIASTVMARHQGKRIKPSLSQASDEHDHWKLGLGELTPQQRQIVRLASDGLTNRQIGDRLFLSPRTVSSHLYRSYPKLGIAGRRQLRDVIARASTPTTAPENAESETLL
jgi:DNA-binding NarL/FixJ family response regulator